jgi:hypothetical protein
MNALNALLELTYRGNMSPCEIVVTASYAYLGYTRQSYSNKWEKCYKIKRIDLSVPGVFTFRWAEGGAEDLSWDNGGTGKYDLYDYNFNVKA